MMKISFDLESNLLKRVYQENVKVRKYIISGKIEVKK